MLTATICLAALSAGVDSWEISPPFKEDLKINHEVEMYLTEDTSGDEMEVTFMAITEVGKAKGDDLNVSFGWEGLDAGGQAMDDMMFDGMMGKNGFLKEMSDGDDLRNMWAPFFFVFPEGAVDKGSKWEAKDEDGGLTFQYECLGTAKLKDVETMKFAMQMKSKNANGFAAEGNFWVRKDGLVQKYKVEIENWFIPMAGGVFQGEVEANLAD